MKLTFPVTAEPEEIAAELAKLDSDPACRVLAARFPDGTYRVIGRVVKDPDCNQEDFDAIMYQLANTYDHD